MKATEAESAELKYRFKEHFRIHGYNAPLPPDLHIEMADFPNEWAEACQEFEASNTD